MRKILTSGRVSRIVCATDAGREGELIFRYIYEAAGCRKPVSRLWISSLTPDAIRKGFDKLRPGSEYDRLADAASGRSRADWLVGMNLSRAYSIVYNEELSVGRVQTPTLAMIVDREIALRQLRPRRLHRGRRHISGTRKSRQGKLSGNLVPSRSEVRQRQRRPSNGISIACRWRGGQPHRPARSHRRSCALSRSLPRRSGCSRPCSTTLRNFSGTPIDCSASAHRRPLTWPRRLYERHKLISYPRTDSRHLSADVAGTAPEIVAAISTSYQAATGCPVRERAP